MSTVLCKKRLFCIAADLPCEHSGCCHSAFPHPPSDTGKGRIGFTAERVKMLLSECTLTGAVSISPAPVTDTRMPSQGIVKKTGLKPISFQPVPASCADKAFDNIAETSYQCWTGLSQRYGSLTAVKGELEAGTSRCLHPKNIPYKQ